MTFTKKIAAAALCAGLVLPASAQAATVVHYTSAPGAVVNFLQTFTFTPPQAGTLRVVVKSKKTNSTNNVNFALNGVKLNGTNLTVLSRGIIEAQTYVMTLLVPAGAQTLTVKGSSQVNGQYTVSFAVPEPATWALMVLGFGAVGFAMRRRRQADGSFGALSVA